MELGTGPLQIRDGINFPHDKTLDNTILRPNAFVSKSLFITERRYCNIERETLE